MKNSIGKVSADMALAKLLGKQTEISCLVPHAARNDGWMYAQLINQGMPLAPETF